MADKELRKMSRAELIEIIYALQQNEKEICLQNDELTRQLEDKILRIENAGSIAEAALSLNRVFEDAQKAAEQYLDSVLMIGHGVEAKVRAPISDGVLSETEEKLRASEAALQETEERLRRARGQYEQIKAESEVLREQTRISADVQIRQARKQAEEIEQQARKQAEEIEQQARKQAEEIEQQTRQHADVVLRKAEEDSSRIREQAQRKTAAGIQRFWKDVEMVLRKHPELAAGLYEERPCQEGIHQRAEAN